MTIKIFLLAVFIGLVAKDAEADCVGCELAVVFLPIAALTIDLGTTSVVWMGGHVLGTDGRFWRTYWMGLGISAAAALGAGLAFDSFEVASAVLILGLPVGNIYGYWSSPAYEQEAMGQSTGFKVGLLKLRF